jgi:signal peptidase II
MLPFAVSFVVAAVVDQGIKAVVSKRSSDPPAGLIYRENSDGGFAAAAAGVGAALLLVAAGCMVAVLVLSDWPSLMAVGLGAALGGAASNLLDRTRHGFVIDYIEFANDRAANLADLAIAAGSFAGLLALIADIWG